MTKSSLFCTWWKRRTINSSKILVFGESLFIFLASDVQLTEIEKFCTEEVMFPVVQIDLTFNLGPYECTPISDQNLLLKRKSTGKPPVFVGPVILDPLQKRWVHLQGLSNQVEILKTWLAKRCLIWNRQGNGSCQYIAELLSQSNRKVVTFFQTFSTKCGGHIEHGENRRNNSKPISMRNLWKGFIRRVLWAQLAGQWIWWGIWRFARFTQTCMVSTWKWGKDLRIRQTEARLQKSVDWLVPVKFYTLEAESTNNRIKAKTQRKASGFMRTIEAIRSTDEEQQEDFALALAGEHKHLQLRQAFENF